jgi:hypothetical protein
MDTLYEAATVLMTRTRKWSRLRAWGIGVAKRRGMKRATVAVARKLGVIMHRMWVTGRGFEFGNPQPQAARRNPAERRTDDGCARPSRTPGAVKSVTPAVMLNMTRFGDHVL